MQNVITINNYAEFEQKFDNVMQETAEKFVVIGYMLKVARDTDILRESGYSTMGEFAQKRYGLTKDIASRYIAINDRYSEGGYSEQLDPRYKAFGYAKLAEMLTLPDVIVEEISPDMTREDIRGIKGEITEERNISDIEVMLEEKDQGMEMVDSLIGKVLYQICYEHKEIFKKLWRVISEKSLETEDLMEIFAPSGIAMLSCRIPGTGRLMLSIKGLDENLQIINLRSNEKEEVTWENFMQTADAFVWIEENDWKDEWRKIYNEDIPAEKPEVAPAQPKSERVVKSVKPEKPKEVPKKEPEKSEPVVPDEQLPGQMEVTDYPELMPEAEPVAVQEEKDDKNRLGGNRESIPESEDSGRDESKGNEMSGREPETPQSNGEGIKKEEEELETWVPKNGDDLELKPCPFCGNENIIYIKYRCAAGERYKVTCGECVATIDPGYAQQRSIVQKMWNRRVNNEKHLA